MSPLGPPPTSDQLRDFPSYALSETLPLVRIHLARRHPWYFSSHLTGRFDLPAPNGTCYLAESPLGAYVEVFQRWIVDRIPIPRSEVDVRHASTLFVPRDITLADCTHSRALEFGVTGAIHAATNRTLTQAWAAALNAAGFEGIRYLVSTAPTMQLVGFALFHTSGEATWPVAARGPIPAGLVDEIERVFGVLVR